MNEIQRIEQKIEAVELERRTWQENIHRCEGAIFCLHNLRNEAIADRAAAQQLAAATAQAAERNGELPQACGDAAGDSPAIDRN